MASVKAMLPYVSADGGAAELLVRLNRRLVLELGCGEFVALTVARYVQPIPPAQPGVDAGFRPPHGWVLLPP